MQQLFASAAPISSAAQDSAAAAISRIRSLPQQLAVQPLLDHVEKGGFSFDLSASKDSVTVTVTDLKTGLSFQRFELATPAELGRAYYHQGRAVELEQSGSALSIAGEIDHCRIPALGPLYKTRFILGYQLAERNGKRSLEIQSGNEVRSLELP